MNVIDYGLISFVIATGIAWVILRQRDLIVKDAVVAIVCALYCIGTFVALSFFRWATAILPTSLVFIMVILVALRRVPAFERWLNKKIRLP